jgi:chromosome segregation ATPase
MNEFDLRKFLYHNPLLENQEGEDEASKKALDKKEDELDEKDMEHETLKEKIKHHEGAIENIRKELADLSDDLGEDEEDLKKEKEEVKEVTETPKLTKEGLRDMIKEKITSILNEQEDDEVIDDTEETIEKNTDVEVKDDTTVKADIEDEVDIDDESAKSEMEIDSEIAGESPEKAAVLSLLTKAQEMVPTLGGDEEKNGKMVNQINNTITMFARDYLAQAPK